MRNLVYSMLGGLVVLAGIAAFQNLRPHEFVKEEDNTSLLEAIGTEIKAGNAHQTPTTTPYLTSTPTRTPKPATSTPLPTYGPHATQEAGIYVVPAWTETAVPALTVNAMGPPPCETVTAIAYAQQECWRGA